MDMADTKTGKISILALSGQLNIDAAPAFEQHCAGLIERGERQIVLDLSALKYLSSAGIRCILSLHRSLQQAGGRLALCAPSEPATMVLQVAGIIDRFPIFKTREEIPAEL